MVLAKVTSKGQVTIPIEIRQKLNINDGKKYCFMKMTLDRLLLKMLM